MGLTDPKALAQNRFHHQHFDVIFFNEKSISKNWNKKENDGIPQSSLMCFAGEKIDLKFLLEFRL